MRSRKPVASSQEAGSRRETGNGCRPVGVLASSSLLLAPGFLVLALVLIAGCAKSNGPTTRPMTIRERQDQAMKDPMGYSPDMDRTDVSGGGLTDFDRDGFGKDLKNALNP